MALIQQKKSQTAILKRHNMAYIFSFFLHKHCHGNVPFVGFTLSHSFCRWPSLKYVTGNNLIWIKLIKKR